MRHLAFLPYLVVLAGCSMIVDGRFEPADTAVISCQGEPNGTLCVGADHCLNGECRLNTCGDGVVSTARGEQCDDGNSTGGDGCQPGSCTFSCSAVNNACPDDGNDCNGVPSCNVVTHVCMPGTAVADGSPCAMPGGGTGACSAGFCAAVGCGNGTVDAGEDCEPSLDPAGCRADCVWNCVADFQCPSDDRCNAPRGCDVSLHQCVDRPDVVCDDSMACTLDACDPSSGSCVFTSVPDVDGDGFLAAQGNCPGTGDCDDTNFAINPNAPEQPNSIDDDCDQNIDENLMLVTCGIDADGDGYTVRGTEITVSSCPNGYVPIFSSRFDCNDRNRDVSPAYPPGRYEPVPHCPDGSIARQYSIDGTPVCGDGSPGSYDYDCNDLEEPLLTVYADDVCGLITTCDGGGWTKDIPGCGRTGSFQDCYYQAFCLRSSEFDRTQYCR